MNNDDQSTEAGIPEGMDETVAARAAARIETQLESDGGDACPAHVPIPEFMHAVAEGKLAQAAEILRKATPLPGLCGRVCPPDQCEIACKVSQKTLPMRIGHLVRYVSDWERDHPDKDTHKPWRSHRVAVIGSGPAGMVCAGTLARQGYPVTIFEGLERPGGVLRYGVQDSHFPESILDWEIRILKRLGVEINCNVMVGEKIKMEDLLGELGFEAVYIATGAGMTHFLGIPGENLDGVYTADEFLTRANLGQAFADESFKTDGRIVVVGADNSEIRALCKALGEESVEGHILEEDTEEDSAIEATERQLAEAAGFQFHWQTRPLEVLSDPDKEVAGLKCVKLAQEGEEKIAKPGTEFVLEADNVVIAGGNPPNPLEWSCDIESAASSKPGLVVEERKCLPPREQIYSGAAAGRGAAAVVAAASAGRAGAESIHKSLCDEDWTEIQAEDEWDEFVEWCHGIENVAHE